MWVFLSGPMGAGKSTVGRIAAQRLGIRFVDLDAEIVRRAGASVEQIFARDGERGFRQRERDELEHVFASLPHAVVALGGGTVVDASTRRALLAKGSLFTLTAPVAVLVERIHAEDGAASRPLLRGDAGRALESLMAARAEAYAECHDSFDTAYLSPDEVATNVVVAAARTLIAVPLGKRTYCVEVVWGDGGRLGAACARLGPTHVLLVTDENVAPLYAADVEASLAESGLAHTRLVLASGEGNKTMPAIESLWRAAQRLGLDRSACFLALGGGVVGDLTGFAAATYGRGVRWVQGPTTLLAAADASVGGKTGVDFDGAKNAVGAVHQPKAVVIDVTRFATLPAAEWTSGLAEVVKAAWIEGEGDVAALESDAAALRAREPEAVLRAVTRAVRTKARIVSLDEHDEGLRRTLNFGHTFGHAHEAAEGLGAVTHGEAVTRGMMLALGMGVAAGSTPPRDCQRAAALFDALGVSWQLERSQVDAAVPMLDGDKKRAGASLTYLLAHAPGRVVPVPMSLAAIPEAWRRAHDVVANLCSPKRTH